MREEKPHFSVVNILPMFVIGANELNAEPKDIDSGTNHSMFSQVLGIKTPYATPAAMVHLHDISALHIKALDPKIPDGQCLAGSYGAPGTSV